MLPKMARSSLMVKDSNQSLHIHAIWDLNVMVRKLQDVQPKVVGSHSHLLATESVSIDLYGHSFLIFDVYIYLMSNNKATDQPAHLRLCC